MEGGGSFGGDLMVVCVGGWFLRQGRLSMEKVLHVLALEGGSIWKRIKGKCRRKGGWEVSYFFMDWVNWVGWWWWCWRCWRCWR